MRESESEIEKERERERVHVCACICLLVCGECQGFTLSMRTKDTKGKKEVDLRASMTFRSLQK